MDKKEKLYSQSNKTFEYKGGRILSRKSDRVYAAINLVVPARGEEWLDNMIIEAKRFNAACFAMQGLLAANRSDILMLDYESTIRYAYKYADEILKQENE